MFGDSGDKENAVVTLTGSLDISRRGEVAALLPAPESARRVVIDCSQADFVDSTIMTVLMRYRRAFVDAGGDPFEIVIVVSPNLRRIFDIAGLSSLVTIVSASRRDGLESVDAVSDPKEPVDVNKLDPDAGDLDPA
jgi:anti-anti-sigma factor